MSSKTDNENQQLRDEVEALTARVKNLEALIADKGRSKSGNSGWVTFFAVLLGILMYRLFRYLSG